MLDKEKKWKNHSGFINIYSDLKKSDIPKIIAEKDIYSIQFYQFRNPQKQTWKVLNEFFLKYPHIGLRIVWYEKQDFSFYEEIPNLRSFTIASYKTKDFSKLLSNTKLKHFGIEETASAAVDLSFIKAFKDLESLYVDGMKKGLENVKYLKKLKKLTFSAIKLDNLDFLSDLKNLEELHLRYGSYKNLTSLSNLKQLKSIEFSRVRQIPNFEFLNSLKNLVRIEFEGMAVMEEIPDLSNLNKLRGIFMFNNLRLQRIGSISKIKNLMMAELIFASASKAIQRKHLMKQLVEILMESNSIEYTNMHWTNEEIAKKLVKKGIKNSWEKGAWRMMEL